MPVESRLGCNCITRVELENYRSFAAADVTLQPLTAIVGANSAGKSNFVDALQFVAESLTDSLPIAVERRGGFAALAHRSEPRGRTRNLRIALSFEVNRAKYRYEVQLKTDRSGYRVGRERLDRLDLPGGECQLEVVDGEVLDAPNATAPPADGQRLTLPVLASLRPLNSVYRFLSSFRKCAISTDRVREPQDPGQGRQLEPDGRNAASVLREVSDADRSELLSVLAVAVPGIMGVHAEALALKRALTFEKKVGDGQPLKFGAAQMSDGTLRLFGILLALYQPDRPTVLTVEEPETALHFAAAQAMVETFAQHTDRTQVIFTTHSADVVDAVALEDVRLVRSEAGVSVIEPLSETTFELVHDQLFTAGELLRAAALRGVSEPTAA